MPEETTVEIAAKPTLAEEYNIGEAQATVEAPAETPAPVETAPPAPRDPSTGRFQSKHSSLIHKKAKDCGLSDEEIADYSPEDLRAYLIFTSNERSIEAHAKAVERATAPSKPSAPVATVASPVDDIGFEDGYLDERMEKVLKSLSSRIRQLENFVLGQAQKQATESKTQFLDRLFSKHNSFLGKGSRTELKEGSPELIRRNAVLTLAETMKGDLAENIDKAVGILYGNSEAPKGDKPPASGSHQEWIEAGLARPTHRTGAMEPNGVEKAAKSVAHLQKENGYADTHIAEEFPL